MAVVGKEYHGLLPAANDTRSSPAMSKFTALRLDLDRQGLLACALAVAVFVALLLSRRQRTPGKLLPMPPGRLPIVGHRPALGPERPWLKMKEWADTYGPIYRIQLGNQQVVVLSDARTANALLDKRSAIYSSRPHSVVGVEYVGRGLRMLFMPYNELWKKQRKYMNQLTSPTAAATYEPLQDLESTHLMLDLLQKPNEFWEHLTRYAGSTIMGITFNKRAKLASDPDITDMQTVIKYVTRVAVPGAYIVDTLPWLDYLPRFLAPWKRAGDEAHAQQRTLFMRHLTDVKRDMAEGREARCFTQAMLGMKNQELSELQIAFLGGTMYGAGSDTTADATSSFILAMVKHPHIVRKAHAELDRVVGRERLPAFSDQSDLVYIRAIIAEMHRWRPVIAGGLPHRLDQDDVYEGYFLPKGCSVVANAWAIHQQPDLYPDPQTFKPERFITSENTFQGVPGAERGHFGFGFGRRVCPGLYIGERSIFIIFSRLLWAFDFGYAHDAQGEEIPIDENEYTSGFSSHPKPFLCSITPRDAEVTKIVAAHAQQVGL
ncbi:MAG: hypothetical protein CYPHOPRED_001859 [Cyphobasidiales sp. Tagirdzhanova-0007]|nr:MAG: hypothetical protein CYPHOPRED_001859 [Cyphobasidiales sp. Tagirdzhanova-0007]